MAGDRRSGRRSPSRRERGESGEGVLRAVVMCIRRCISPAGRSETTTSSSSNLGSFRAKETRNRVEVSCSLFVTKCYRARDSGFRRANAICPRFRCYRGDNRCTELIQWRCEDTVCVKKKKHTRRIDSHAKTNTSV